jgi:hypothetical protein
MGRGSIRSKVIRDEPVWDKAIFLKQLAHQSERHHEPPGNAARIAALSADQSLNRDYRMSAYDNAAHHRYSFAYGARISADNDS